MLIAIATVTAAIQYFKHPESKSELIAVILAPLLVLLANFNNLLSIVDFGNLDVVSVSVSFSILMFFWVVFKENYLQLIPIARAVLVENMQDSILVLDDDGLVIDLNSSATKLFKQSKNNVIGEPLARLVGDDEIYRKLAENDFIELFLDNKYLQALNTRISIHSNDSKGLLIVFRDISELKIIQSKLEEAQKELLKANQELQVLANTDSLTGLPNRRSFFEMLSLELARVERHNGDLCMLILDLDYFKKINDTHGHSVGDAVLQRVSGIIKGTARENDITGRLGGEEFGLVLPDTDLSGAKIYAERLRQSIESSHAENGAAITASIGITAAKRGMNVEEIFEHADTALYHSKNTGRNKVSIN